MGHRRINRGVYRREELRAQAAEIDRERQSRGPKEQLALLDKRLGVDVGAKRERAKLNALIESELERRSKKSKSIERSTATDRESDRESEKRGRSRSDRRKAKASRNRAREEKRSTTSRSRGST